MWRFFLLLLIYLLSLPKSVWAYKDPVDVAKSFLQIREIKPNRSPEIDLFNKPFGNIGGPYCATGVAYCLKKSGVELPKGYSLAKNYLKYGWNTTTAREVLNGKSIPSRNDLVIWGKGSTIYGHVGIVISYDPSTGILTTIEFNTSSDDKSSQREGDGVFIKKRKIEPYNYFKIIGFSEVKFRKSFTQSQKYGCNYVTN